MLISLKDTILFVFLVASLCVIKGVVCSSPCTTGYLQNQILYCNFIMLGDDQYDNQTILADASTYSVIDTTHFVHVVSNLINDTTPQSQNSCSVNGECISCLRDEIFVRTWLDDDIKPHSDTIVGTKECLGSKIALCASSLGVCVHGKELKKDLCLMLNCGECRGIIDWAQCRSVRFGFWKTILIVVLVILLLCILPWISPLFYGCARCCKALFSCAVSCACCKGKSYSKSSAVELDLLSDEDEESDDGLTEANELPDGAMMKRKASDGRMLLYSKNNGVLTVTQLSVLCFTLLITLASAQSCTGVISSSSIIPTCVVYNITHKECMTKPTLSLTLPGVGTSACTVMTVQNETVGNLTVTFESATIITRLNNQYYTSSWKPGYTAVRRCRGAEGARCNRYSEPKGCSNCMQLNPCGQLSSSFDYLYAYPGESGCLDGPTCSCAAGSGNACQNYRFSLIPDGPSYRVMRPSFTEQEAVISVRECIQDSCKTFKVSTKSPQIVASNITMTFSGLYTTITPSFDSFSVVERMSDGVAKLVPAAAPQAQSADIFGDIQAGTFSSLQRNRFNWARNLVTMRPQCDGMSWFWRVPSASKFNSYNSFPTTWGGLTHTYESGTLKSPTGGLTGSMLTLSYNNNVTFSLMLDVIVPKIVKSGEATGCYSCSDMAYVNITAKSLTREGTCSVSSLSGTVSSPQIGLKTREETFLIGIQYTSKVLRDTIVLSCNGGSDSMNITVMVVEKSILTPNSEGFVDRDQPKGSSLKLSTKLGLGLGIALPVISAVVLIVVLIFCGCLGTTCLSRTRTLCCCGRNDGYGRVD